MDFRLILISTACLLILSSVVSAIPTFETVTEKGFIENIVSGDKNHLMYIYRDSNVTEGHEYSISTVSFLNTSQNATIELGLFSENGTRINMTHFRADDTENNETFYMVSWNMTPEEDTTYTLHLTIDDDLIYERDMTVSVVERVVEDRDVVENNIRLDSIPIEDEDIETVRNLLIEHGIEYTPLELEEMKETGHEKVKARKKIRTETLSYDDNSSETKTTTTISITPKEEGLEYIQVIEIIPKTVAEHSSQLGYPDLEPVILDEDPVIMWHVDDPRPERDSVSYETSTNKSVTGNTILLAKEGENDSGTNLNSLLAIILIPIVAGLIIYFNKFAPEKK
ncbi:MAG: hypothetical protein ACOCU6_02850 [Nanoarchaeota archaeon]